MTPEYAAALLAFIEADPKGFAAACNETRADDAEGLANEIVDMLSTEGGAEEDANPDDAADSEAQGETV